MKKDEEKTQDNQPVIYERLKISFHLKRQLKISKTSILVDFTLKDKVSTQLLLLVYETFRSSVVRYSLIQHICLI